MEAVEPLNLHLTANGEHRPDLHPNVRGYGYYFPVLITLELEPEEPETGTAYIRHFTTTGQSLAHIFTDRDVTLEHGQEYNFIRPTNPAYSYEGYKKRQEVEPDPGGNWDPGTGPGSFEYDSSQFQKYYVYFYYDPLTTLEYQLDVQPPTWTMKVGETKEFIAHQRSRRAGSSDPWSSWTPIPDTQVSWTIGNSSIASIDVAGISRGASVGTTNVRAAWNRLSDSSSLTVEAAAEGVLDGDFTINPSTINFRDPFSLVPEPFTIPDGCTYTSHSYRFSNGGYAYSSPMTTATTATSYPYSNYPSNIDVGTVYVSIKINARCGTETVTTGYIKEKPLVVNNDGRPNQGPVFYGGWFDEGERYRTRDNEVPELVIGYEYDLGIVEEDHEDPDRVLPRDPEGDYPITYNWNFLGNSSNFIRGLHSSFNDPSREVYTGIDIPNDPALRDTYHTVEVTARDRFGTPVTSDTVHIAIVGPEPRAVCRGEVTVKSGRTFVNTFDTSRSNSPLGRTVTVDRWEGIETPFLNNTDASITKKVYVYVRDSAGLFSERTDCTVIVLPDTPPVAKLSVPSFAVRGTAATIGNQSYSPDGDIIVSISYRYKYDASNNGFADDAWVTATGGDLARLSFNPNRVGKYLFSATVCEDHGRCSTVIEPTADASRTMDVLNNEPEVSFKIIGENNQPELDTATRFNMNTVLSSWNLYKTNTVETLTSKERQARWSITGTALKAGQGLGVGDTRLTLDRDRGYDPLRPHRYINNGLGDSGYSPWRSPTSITSTFLLPSPTTPGKPFIGGGRTYGYSKKHVFVSFSGSSANGGWSGIAAFSKSKAISQGSNLTYDWQLGGEVKTIPPNRTAIASYNPEFVVTDQYIYTSRSWGFACGGDNMCAQVETVVIDHTTGEIVKTLDGTNLFPTSTTEGFSKGNYLILQNGTQLQKYDPQLNVVQTLTLDWKAPPPSQSAQYFAYAYGPWSVGPDGHLYRIEWWRGTASSSRVTGRNAHLVKIDLDTMTYAWKTKLFYDSANRLGQNYYERDDRDIEIVMFDHLNMEAIAPSFGDSATADAIEYISMATGVVRTKVNQDGYMLKTWGETFTADGYYWNDPGTIWSWGTSRVFQIYQPNKTTYQTSISIQRPRSWFEPGTNDYYNYYNDTSGYSVPVGDGMALYMLNVENDRQGDQTTAVGFAYGPPTTNALLYNTRYLGQFISPNNITDEEVGVTLTMPDPQYDDDVAGLSFRMVDPRNRYAVEIDGTSAALVKYVNGARTVLRSTSYPFAANTDYPIRVRAVGKEIDVWIGGIPMFQDVQDETFVNDGKFGPFSEKALVSFSNLHTKKSNSVTSLIPGYAIWEEGTATAEASYTDITFTDPENDPQAGSYNWRYLHTPKFMNHQGVSTHHNKSYANGTLTFDKVGEYTIQLEAYDDPHPNYRHPSNVFGSYRKKSNTFTQKFIVHRRPVAVAAVSQNPTTGIITWSNTKQSYDPDRWVNASSYSAPDTPGMNYGVDKGIKDERFYYVTPSGTLVSGQLTRPEEIGTYEVYYQVMDEYGAWSYPWSGTVTALTLPANRLPVATMTHPNGTQASPTLYTTYRPLLQWSQTDPDPGTVFTRYQLQVTNEANTTLILDSGERNQNTTSTSAAWTPTSNLPAAQKLRARVRVHDGLEWSAWSAQTWMLINNPPTAELTFPSGTQANPTVLTTRRPTIRWTQTDPDPGAVFRYYEVEVINEANTAVVAKTGLAAQNTSATSAEWTVPADLPAGQKLRVRVRVNDGAAWSAWSEVRWMITNRPPVADFAWSPALIYESDDIAITNLSTDPDGDALTYRWTITRPDKTSLSSTEENVTLADAMQGAYVVTLRATDAHGAFDEVVKTILVQDLTIAGQVAHTPEWEAYRQTYNAKFPEKARSETVFWAGEALVLRADVTDTGASGTKPVTVVAQLTATGDEETLTSANRTVFTGTMVEPDHVNTLSDGPYTMRFTVTWSNGHTESHDVPFTILGDIRDVIVLQQRL